MSNLFTLDTLTTELLLKIFKYLDIQDLCRLKATCKRFHSIVTTWQNVLLKANCPLVTNQKHEYILNRSLRCLPPFEKCRVHLNWKNGIYAEKSFLYEKRKYLPWLHLDKDFLWLSRGKYIRAYKRKKKIIDHKRPHYILTGESESDICRFVLKDNYIITGLRSGGLWLWSFEKEKYIFNARDCHDSDVDAVDILGDVVVSGSRDDTVKIWKNVFDLETPMSEKVEVIQLLDRIWSVSLNSSHLAIGSGGSHSEPIIIYDLKRGQRLADLGYCEDSNAGVRDIKWESPQILWSCSYDSYVRRWDLRTNCCVQKMMDPFASTIFCFDYDFVNTILTGTQGNGRIVLWDVRTSKYVQMYFLASCKGSRSSPVYSMAFDADVIFAATDQHLNLLDFSVASGNTRNYRGLFAREIYD